MNFWKSFFNVKSTILLLSLTAFVVVGAVLNSESMFETVILLVIVVTLQCLWAIETTKSMNEYFEWFSKKNGL